jgi:large subunit ribosomal protein L6
MGEGKIMSRVGKLPIHVPPGVTVNHQEDRVTIHGPKGTLERIIHPKIEISVNGNIITVTPRDLSHEARALWGLTRALLNNMVVGVNQGFRKELEIVGVGYRVEHKGNTLVLSLGYSHPVEFELPRGIEAKVEKQTRITLQGIDKELVGQTAAKVRSFRRPEPYKGKGIRYLGEVIRHKVGKGGGGK